MYMLCERLHVLPNGGGLMDQAPTNIARIEIMNRVRDERDRAREEQHDRRQQQDRPANG